MKGVFLVLALILSIQIFRNKGAKKIAWFFGSILFFPVTIIIVDAPYMPFTRLIALALFFSTVTQYKNWWLEFKKFPLKAALIIVFFSLFLIGVTDDRVGLFTSLFRFFITFVEEFSIVFLCYLHLKDLKDVIYIYNFLIKCFIAFTIYGLINFVTGVNFYDQFLEATLNIRDLGKVYADAGDRFRIASFAWHPIYYGLLLGLMIITTVFLLSNKLLYKNHKKLYRFALALMALNLLWTNSRTPLIATIAGLGIFFLLGYNFQKQFKVALIGIIMGVGFLIASPSSFSIVEETINTFSAQGSKLQGSSVEMRDAQLQSSLVLFYQKPVFGHGFSYIVEGLGFGEGDKRNSDSSFAGFESYSYRLLIEQGVAGIFCNVFLVLSVIVFLVKKRNDIDLIGKTLAYGVMGTLVTFLMFILGTGDMASFLFYMSLLGVNIKLITILSKKKTVITKPQWSPGVQPFE
jgi:hypothetical protein